MAQVVYAKRALDHLQRAFEFLVEKDADVAVAAARAIRSAVSLLGAHPFIGRAVEDNLRELVISFGKTGYVALYRVVPERDEVRVLAIRAQRELDYPP